MRISAFRMARRMRSPKNGPPPNPAGLRIWRALLHPRPASPGPRWYVFLRPVRPRGLSGRRTGRRAARPRGPAGKAATGQPARAWRRTGTHNRGPPCSPARHFYGSDGPSASCAPSRMPSCWPGWGWPWHSPAPTRSRTSSRLSPPGGPTPPTRLSPFLLGAPA